MDSKPATMSDAGKPAAATGGGGGGGAASTSFPRPPLSSSSTTVSSSSSSPATARGGVAIGVPAHRPPQPFTTFGPTPPASSLHHQHQFVSMHRPPDPPPSSTPPARATMGSFGSQLRPSSAPPPSRLAQTPLRPIPPPSSTSSFNSQRMPPPSSLTQHHMHSTIPSSSPSSSFRPPLMQQQRPIQTLQQRPYQTPLPHLQATPQNPNFQNPNPNRVPISGPIGPIALISSDATEQSDRILTKRTIHELFNQIDTSEKVEAEVEDVLIEVAEEFVESLTTFACSLAKHRKSSTLEAKDILLHAERNWNITLPGFSGDEIKMYKKQNVNDIHRERLALIKKTMGDPRRAYLTSQQAPQNKP